MENLEGLEDLTSLWTFDEDVDDLKRQLESKTNELEAVKKAAIEQTRKYNDNVKKLIRLLGRAYKERDEAKDTLQQLLLLQTNQAPSTTGMATLPSFSSQISPSMMVNSTTVHASAGSKKTDWAVIENSAKGRPRPQQGHLLKAVCEARQLFNSVAKPGSHSVLPVPQTPPQVADAPQVPATPVRAHKARGRPRSACTNSQMFDGSSSVAASSSAAAGSLSASNCSSLSLTDQIQMTKRQRICIEID